MSFHAGPGDAPTLMQAVFVRFCADGSLRGPDNFVVARCVDGLWHVGGCVHRELDCEGPVRVRIISRPGHAPVHHGPFEKLRTINGVLHAGDYNLQVTMPGRRTGGGTGYHEVAFLP